MISVAATVLACVYLQPLLPVQALGGHCDSFHRVRSAVGKIDVHQNIARDTGLQHEYDDSGREMHRCGPVRLPAIARAIGLRKSKQGCCLGCVPSTARQRLPDEITSSPGIAAAIDRRKQDIGRVVRFIRWRRP